MATAYLVAESRYRSTYLSGFPALSSVIRMRTAVPPLKRPETAGDRPPRKDGGMDATALTRITHRVLPQNEKYLRDVLGSPLHDGACVLDSDREVGYVRLEFGTRRGPDSAYWDGWFTVTRTRDAHPLRGKVANGQQVQLMGKAS
jgi:hypothetical protein